MTRLIRTFRALCDSRSGSVRLQYAILVAGMAIVTLMTVQTASTKVADKISTITAALNKIQF